MSRIGKNPINIPEGVSLNINGSHVHAQGKLGELDMIITPYVSLIVQGNTILVHATGESKKIKQMWGTTRMLLHNLLVGVSSGFIKKLEINGVGYRAFIQDQKLKLTLGFSHDIFFSIPQDIKISVEGDRNNIIVVSGISKQRVGQIASELRAFRPPEPYKGKGIKYVDEYIVRKEGKKK